MADDDLDTGLRVDEAGPEVEDGETNIFTGESAASGTLYQTVVFSDDEALTIFADPPAALQSSLTSAKQSVKSMCGKASVEFNYLAAGLGVAAGVLVVMATGPALAAVGGAAFVVGGVSLSAAEIAAIAAAGNAMAGVLTIGSGSAWWAATKAQECHDDPPRFEFSEVSEFAPIAHPSLLTRRGASQNSQNTLTTPVPPATNDPAPIGLSSQITILANGARALEAFTTTMERLDGALTQYQAHKGDLNLSRTIVRQAKVLAINGQACAAQMSAIHMAANVFAANWGHVAAAATGLAPIDPIELGWGLIAGWQINRAEFVSHYNVDIETLGSIDAGIVTMANRIRSGELTLQSAAQGLTNATAGVAAIAAGGAFASLAQAYTAAITAPLRTPDSHAAGPVNATGAQVTPKPAAPNNERPL